MHGTGEEICPEFDCDSMRPDEISNSIKAKRRRGSEAANKVARRISKKSAPLSHEETVALFCVPITDEDKARRDLFQFQLAGYDPSLSFYYHDLSKISEKQKLFLEAFGQSGGIVRDACSAARVSRRELARWLEEDESFREMYEDTEEDATDDLEAVAIGRAKAQSDTLMALLLKAKRPQKYVERAQVELTKKTEKQKKQVWEIGDMKLEF